MAVVAAFLFTVACQRVPLSGRNQLMLVNSKDLLPMSFKSYREFLDTNRVDRSGSDVAMVKRVGARIQKSVEDYLRENNKSEILNGFQWEFNVVESNDVNAFCMPGGKVVFYKGILPICKDEAGVAVVMGHEVAHAIASHGAERMSQGLLSQGILTAGQVGLGLGHVQQTATNAATVQQYLWSRSAGGYAGWLHSAQQSLTRVGSRSAGAYFHGQSGL